MLKSNEKGTAFLEMALIAPFFLVLLLCVFDISRCVVIHSQLVVAAKEGLRNSASINYMEPLPWRLIVTDGADPATDAYELQNPTWASVALPAPPAEPPGPIKMLSNIARIIRAKLPQLDIDPNDWQVQSEVTYGIPNSPDRIMVEINVKYVGLLPLFDGTNIAVRVFGPYIT